MNVASKLSQPPRPQRRKIPRPRRHKAPAPRATVATVLGYSGLIAHSVLTGNLAHLGLQQLFSGGWLFGLFAIAISLLSAVAGIGVIFIPEKLSSAFRLSLVAGFSSLAVGLLLLATGIHLLLLAGIATACFWLCAIAILKLHRQRLRRKPSRTRAARPIHR